MAFKETVLLLTVFVFGTNAGISWYNCDSSAPIQIKEINLKSSYPIQIKPNAKVSASGRYYNGYSATSQSKFKAYVKIEKKIGSGWFSTFIKIPCVSKIGSCTYEITCAQIPNCPGKTGDQSFDQEITIPANYKIPGGVLGRFLGSGTFKLRVDVREAGSNKRVACGGGQGEIKL